MEQSYFLSPYQIWIEEIKTLLLKNKVSIATRKGNEIDPYIQIEESIRVAGNTAILREIPLKFNKVIIKTDTGELLREVNSKLIADNDFYVDYETGIIYFNPKHESKILTFSYMGTGYFLIPSGRVVVNNDGTSVTLDDRLNDLNYDIIAQKLRVDTQLSSVPQPSEVVDARVNRKGYIYNTVKDRLDDEQKKIEDAFTSSDGKIYNTLAERMNSEKNDVDSFKVSTISKLADISINVKNYGAKGDGVTDDTIAIQAAVDYAKTVNGTVLFPYGKTFMVSSAITIYEGITLLGYGATIKGTPNRPNNRRLLDGDKTGFLYSSDVDSKPLVIKGLTLDGNYATQIYPMTHSNTAKRGTPWINDPDYTFEQNMLLIVGADQTKAGRLKVIIEDVYCKDSTSDGIHIHRNVDALISNCFTNNCWRGGIVASGGYSKIKINNCHVGGERFGRGIDLEVDAKGYGDTYRTDIMVNNLECDGTFDVGLQEGAYGYFTNVVQHKPNFSYNGGGNSHARFVNCRFVRQGNSTGSPAMYFPSDVLFQNCEFVAYKDPLDATVVTYSAMNISYNTTNSSGIVYMGQRPTFKNCRFTAQNKAVGDTFYGIASGFTDPVTNDNMATFEDCYISPDFDRFYHMAAGGKVSIHNLTCDATQVISLNYAGVTVPERFYLKVSGHVRGTFTEYIRSGRTYTVNDVIEHVNVYMDESKNVLPTSGGALITDVTTIGNRVILGTTVPSANVPSLTGDVYRLKTPIANSTYQWVASNNSRTGGLWARSVTLGAIEGAPAMPSSFNSFSVMDTSYGVSWIANTEPSLVGYNLYVNGVFQATLGTTVTGYFFKDLPPNTTYLVELTAKDSRGLESSRASKSVTTASTMTYLVSDLFNRADNATSLGTAVTGQTWTYDGTDVWQINGNTAYINAGIGVNRALVTSSADMIYVQAQVPTNYNNTRLVFRKTTASNEWTFGTNTSNFYVLQKNVGGGLTSVYTSTLKGVSGDVLRVELRGNEIKAFVNGELLTTWTDTFNQAGTIHGMLVQTNNAVRKFDNFSIGNVS